MQTFYRRALSFGLSILALIMALASNAAPAQAASSLWVDDSLTPCHAGAYTSIQLALAAAPASNATINVCAGTYYGPIVIDGKTNLKLIGKPGAVIEPWTNPFNGYLIDVKNSSKITIQGFTIDGLSHVGTSYGNAAIHAYDVAVTIQKNIIQNWQTPGQAQNNAGIMSIWVYTNPVNTIKISSNTINHFQSYAIQVEGPAKLTIASNKMNTPANGANPPTGIRVGGSAKGNPSGSISKNTLVSTAFPTYYGAIGMYIYEASGLKVTGNTLTHWDTGIIFTAGGTYGFTSDGNTISGNKINEVDSGIQFNVGANTANAQANKMKITGNKVTNTANQGANGINFQAYQSGWWIATAENETITGNTFTNFMYGLYTYNSGLNVSVSGKFAPNTLK